MLFVLLFVDLYIFLLLLLLIFVLLLLFVLSFVLSLLLFGGVMRLGTLRRRRAAKRCTAQYTTATPNASDPNRECASRLRRYVQIFPVIVRDCVTSARQYVATAPWCAGVREWSCVAWEAADEVGWEVEEL